MAPLVMYSLNTSPPCRGALLAAGVAGIKLDLHDINLLAKEQMSEEFLKINPQHTLPTLDDNGFIIWDSHAIVTYLIDKYAKKDTLYPKDLKKRTVINQRLHFDGATLFPQIKGIVFPLLYGGATVIPQANLDAVKASYGFLEKFLGDNNWMAGNTYTLADTSIIASVSSLTAFVPLDNFPKLAAWAKRCENTIPGYAENNAPGAAIFHDLLGKFRHNA